jgi:hypothetical protein
MTGNETIRWKARPQTKHRNKPECINNDLKKLGGKFWTGFMWIRKETVGLTLGNAVMKFGVPEKAEHF